MRLLVLVLIWFIAVGAYAQTSFVDLNQLYTRYDSLDQANDMAGIAHLFDEGNVGLHTVDLYYTAAYFYHQAGMVDSTIRRLEQAVGAGMINANELSYFRSSPDLITHPGWKEIEHQLAESSKQIRHIDSFRFDYTTIPLFLEALQQAQADTSQAAQYFEQYLHRGGWISREFYALRYQGVADIVQTVLQDYPAFYTYLASAVDTQALQQLEDTTRHIFRRFQEYYPDAIFPPVLFVIGKLNTGGTASGRGLFIGLEMFSRSADMPTAELNDWHHTVIRDYSAIPGMVTHELMHFQQSYQDTTENLLTACLKEGICDFLAHWSEGQATHIKNQAYYQDHQEMLWREFKAEMLQQDYSKWLYNGGWEDRPADLGYTLGHLIALSYYEQASDKKLAIWELLNTDNFQRIWQASAYAQ